MASTLKKITKLEDIGSKGLFLAQYTMEAVGFAEFLYEEACQQGVRVLKSMKKKKNTKDLNYMAQKFEANVLNPALIFHKQYGTLNPYTYPGFDCFFGDIQKQYKSIIKLK